MQSLCWLFFPSLCQVCQYVCYALCLVEAGRLVLGLIGQLVETLQLYRRFMDSNPVPRFFSSGSSVSVKYTFLIFKVLINDGLGKQRSPMSETQV